MGEAPDPDLAAAIVAALEPALREGAIQPTFQPIVHLSGGAIASFEVLARWTDPVLGPVPPSTFIPLFEEHGLIAAVTSHIVKQACTAALPWKGAFRLGFNISPVHFQDGEMPDLLEDAVNAAGFPLNRVEVEITETAVIGDIDAARRTSDLLRAKGVRILLDDFGTGYSSLSRLQALPFDTIKIDASFVSSMEESRDSRKIVGAVIGLGQSLGVPVIAEGVETEAQAEMLRRLGCDYAQGWLYGHPVPAEEVPALLRARGEEAHDPEPVDFSTNQRLAQLEAVYAAAPVGLCYVNRELRILNANRRYAEMMGRQVKDLLGHKVGEIDPRATAFAQADLERAMRGEAIPPHQWQLPGGGRGMISVAPARDESGELLGLSLVVTDLPPDP
ncbi:EAL domain-containing protein [Roseomonas harenae]|uniref:EAL domain-containing protein n=1 Tax=Muricoccus harenae TaxID=2692566 RepID=UPI00133164B4|nr:EAL domain-containing protein [Roseomonas harenae]